MNANHIRGSLGHKQRRPRSSGAVGLHRNSVPVGSGSIWAFVAVAVATETLSAGGVDGSRLGDVYRKVWPNAVTWGLHQGLTAAGCIALKPSRFDSIDALDTAADRGAERLYAALGDEGVRRQRTLVGKWIGESKLTQAERETLSEALTRLSNIAVEEAASHVAGRKLLRNRSG